MEAESTPQFIYQFGPGERPELATDSTAWTEEDERVFDGERRGWNDPGRSEAVGWGRLMPDQFGVELPLVSGENEILVRLEVNEPLFGSGFWMRSL